MAMRFVKTAVSQRFFAVLVLLVALFVLFSLTQDRFFTSANIDTLLSGAAILWVVSIGLTFVLIAGGFDLSLGSMLALAGIAYAAFFNDFGLGAVPAIVATVIFGAVLGGGVNGFLIGRVGLSFLVVTLGTLTLFRGIVNLWSDTRTEQVISPVLDWLAFDSLLVPLPVWIMLVTFIVALYVQRSTYFGRDVYAVGGSPDAARLSGIRVSRRFHHCTT